MEVFEGISQTRLKELLNKIEEVRIAVIGDICLDVYWRADMTRSELSRETPHFPLPIVEEYMYPGAAGNCAANIAALKPKSMKLIGVIGKDWRGNALIQKLQELGINTENIIISNEVVTNAYCKPIRKGISHLEYEDPRLDFNNFEHLPSHEEDKLLKILEKCKENIDMLCVSDQLKFGCITQGIREKINLLAQEGMTVIVDSRDRIGLYKGVILKPNEVEGVKAVYNGIMPIEVGFDEYIKASKILAEQSKSKVCMTLGPKGCVYTDSQAIIHIPSYEVSAPIDICGAGDTFLSAFSCAVAAGAKEYEAASFANMAADVTIKKTGVTGTASPEEISNRHKQIYKQFMNKHD